MTSASFLFSGMDDKQPHPDKPPTPSQNADFSEHVSHDRSVGNTSDVASLEQPPRSIVTGDHDPQSVKIVTNRPKKRKACLLDETAHFDGELRNPPHPLTEEHVVATHSPFAPASSRHQRNVPEHAVAHGSYRAYYARRLDDRVSLLQRSWIDHPGARILDIGCNDGSLSISVARDWQPVNVLALDIDTDLIRRARDRLRTLVIGAKRKGEHRANVLSTDSGSSVRAPGMQGAGDCDLAPRAPLGARFPFNLVFRVEDFASEADTLTTVEKSSFSVVLMLSVTKWIHLYGGDIAVKRVFCRARDCLRPGGVFVLEPQPFVSYKRAVRKLKKELPSSGSSDLSKTPVTLSKLELPPEAFAEYLLSTEGGFAHMTVLRDVQEPGQPFNRPIFAFYKAGTTGTQSKLF